MAPRISFPDAPLGRWGVPDPSGVAPEIKAARRRLRAAAFAMTNVDPVTSELVRMRNATFQQCVL